MGNNLKQKCIKNKQILTGTYIEIPLHKPSGNEALFQQLFNVHITCSNQRYLDEELYHIGEIFHQVNGYANQFI